MSTENPAPGHRSAEQRLVDWLRQRHDEPKDGLRVRDFGGALEVRLTEGVSILLASEAAGTDDSAVKVPKGAEASLSVPAIGGGSDAKLAVFFQTAALKHGQVQVELWLAAGACGFVSFDLAGVRVHWETRPKIEGTDWVGLLAMAHGWPEVAIGAEADHEHAEASLVEVLVRAYLGAIERLLHLGPTAKPMVGGGLRRVYDPRHEVLRGRLRGQLDRPGYLRQLAQARPDRVPCRFSVHDTDNLPNRALRWGLHLCLGLLPQVRTGTNTDLGRPVRTDLMTRLRTADARFAGVSWSRVTRSELPRLRRPPRALKAYETSGALPLARLLIEQAHLGGPTGGSSSIALAFDMPALFERAFAQGVADREALPHRDIAQRSWDPKFYTQESAWRGQQPLLRPDVYVPPRHGRAALVADTKWKQVEVARERVEEASHSRFSNTEPNTQDGSNQIIVGRHRFKVLPQDLYQILSYGLAARAVDPSAEVVVALVYPTVESSETEKLKATLRWHEGSAHPWLTVLVLGWPVARCKGRSLRDTLNALLDDAREEDQRARAAG